MFVEEKAKGEVKELDAVSKLLLKAADLIEDHGHCKGQTRSGNGRFCLWGAICMVSHGTPFSDFNEEQPEWKALYRVMAALENDLSPISWNNAPERTGAEVIAKLRAVAFSS
jgi:hypothetical protein